MDSRKMLVLGIMLLVATVFWAQAGAAGHGKKAVTASAEQQALIDIENKWVEAGKKQDPSILEPYLAEGFVSMGSDGSYTSRKDYLAGIKTAKWEISEVSNMKAQVSGNHAIVTGDWRGKGTDPGGKSVDTAEHWIDSFVKSPNGNWQCTSDASATAKK